MAVKQIRKRIEPTQGVLVERIRRLRKRQADAPAEHKLHTVAVIAPLSAVFPCRECRESPNFPRRFILQAQQHPFKPIPTFE